MVESDSDPTLIVEYCVLHDSTKANSTREVWLFGKLACEGDFCDDGYDAIVKSFGSRYQITL